MRITFSPGVQEEEKKEVPRWKSYIEYFDECYMEFLSRTPPNRNYKTVMKYKRAIENSVNHWGEETFKEMIKWICKHANEYPQLKLDINIVAGGHGWSNFIAQKVQQEKGKVYHQLKEL